MARVKRGTTKARRRRSILAQTKGYRFALSKKKRAAKTAIVHAGKHAYAHRRDKKNDFRRLWNVRINAAIRAYDMSYSAFIAALKQKEIGLDRKTLSSLAHNHPETFERIVKQIGS